jgi:HEPN domain-containing protein
MSNKQQHHEAVRWLTTAKEDLSAAILLKEQGMYSHSCFIAQQVTDFVGNV